MKTKSALVTLLLLLAAIGLHVYLAYHYYGLNFGTLTEESACNINATFSCDSTSASSYAAILGIPIALWGAATNLALFSLVVLWWLGWTNNSARIGRFSLWLSGFIAGMSVVMATLSTLFVGAFCLYCIGAYILSFLVFFIIWKNQEPGAEPAAHYLRELVGPARTYLVVILAIPLLAFFFHRSYVARVGASDLPIIVKSSVAEWRANPLVDLAAIAPSLVRGPENSKIVISEFADFRCHHCKSAALTLKAFLQSRGDVQMRFYSFPLDSSCNDAMERGDGVSCWLAKTVYCAEKVAGKGWAVHDGIFSMQDDINKNAGLPFAKENVEKVLATLNVPATEQLSCVESADTEAAIRAQAKAGADAGLTGTPTFYVNGRKLVRGQLLPVLEAVYHEAAK